MKVVFLSLGVKRVLGEVRYARTVSDSVLITTYLSPVLIELNLTLQSF